MNDDNRTGPSFDCYLRIAEAALMRIQLRYLYSAAEDERQNSSEPLNISGYTEWISSETTPAISVGWDWTLTPLMDLTFNPLSIRMNIMLVDEHGMDRGHQATIEATIQLIERTPWQAAVLASLRSRFSRLQ